MKIIIDLDDLYAEATKLMWDDLDNDMGHPFNSRHDMLVFIIKKTVDCYPEYLEKAAPLVGYKKDRKMLDETWPTNFTPEVLAAGAKMMMEDAPVEEGVKVDDSLALSEEDMREIMGDDYDKYYPGKGEIETPELPDL